MAARFCGQEIGVWLQTDVTVSVSESKLARPQEGIKSVVQSSSVLWQKNTAGLGLNGGIDFFFYILTSVPGGPGGPGGP